MSKINFRLYGDQIYGLSNKYLQEYINPEIKKEEFLTSFKSGLLNLKITSIKKPINILPQLIIKDLNCDKIEINIPDENSNLALQISKFKLMLLVKELNEEQILSLLIDKRKNLVKKFIKETIKSIEKKPGSTFLEGLLDSLLNNAINGLKLEFNDIEIYLKCNNNLFLFQLTKVTYNENEGIKFSNINLIFNDSNNTNNKCKIIKNFNATININANKDINNSNNELKINLINLNFEINSNAFQGIMNVVNIFKEINYKMLLIRYKKLIDLNKPKKDVNNKKEYYKSLWFWAIKNIIRLQKYKSQEKLDIFDLINSSQNKYAKKYIKELNKDFDVNENFKDFDCIILPEEINLLKMTKEKVESQLLENKKGNQLANAFNFFFGGGGNDDKKELTDEEKKELNEIYSDEGIIKFLMKKNDIKEKDSKEEKTLDKIKNFFNKISFNFIINEIEILLNNFNSKHSIYLKEINLVLDINRYNKTKNIKFELGDIGYDVKNSFIKNKNADNNQMIKFSKNNDIYEIIFGFKNFDINDKILLFLINFYYSLYYNSGLSSEKNKLFIKKKYNTKNKESKNHFEIIDKIKIINIPYFNFIDTTNNIYLSIILNDFTINKTSINLILNIKDNNSNVIIDNYPIKIDKNEENTKFDLELNNKLNIIFPPNITFFIFSFVYQIKKLKQYYQIIDFIKTHSPNSENNILLYSGHYKKYKTLNVENSFLEKLRIKLAIKNLIFTFQEKNYKTNISLTNLTIIYSNSMSLIFKLGKFSISTYKLSTIFLSMIKLKSPEFDQYDTLINNKIKTEFNIDMNADELNQNVKSLKDSAKNDFNFSIYYGKLINQIIKTCKIYITEIKITYRSEDNIFSLVINRTLGEKQNNIFKFNSESIILNYINSKEMKKIINITEIKEKTNFDYDIMKKKITINLKNPKFTINNDQIKLIKESFNLKIDKKRLKGLLRRNEAEVNISNIIILFNKFSFNIDNINILNNAQFITNTVNATLTKFIMKRSDLKNGIELMREKEFNFVYNHKSKKNRFIEIKSHELNIMISQEDLYYLILYITNIYFDTKSTSNKNKAIKKKVVSSVYKINTLKVNFNLPKINLCLCNNTSYQKVGDLSIINTKFDVKIYYDKNNNNKSQQEFIKQTDYSILINKILFKYIDVNNNEISLLKSGTDKENEKINHIVFKCEKNQSITINIFKNNFILIGDAVYSLYHYFKNAIPIDEIKNKAKSANDPNALAKITSINFNFDYTKFIIPSSFNEKENLCLQIEKFFVIFNSINQSKFPKGSFVSKLTSMSCIISSNNTTRKLFFTKNQFLSVSLKYYEKNLNITVNLDTFIMNLSYTDIATFVRIYYLNKIMIEKEKKLINQNGNINIINSNQNNTSITNDFKKTKSYNYVQELIEKSVLFSGKFQFKNFNITLIDNSSGSYYPFAKLELTNINLDCKQDNSITSNFNLLLSSYNYISCIWEPTIEKIKIQFSYQEDNQYKSKNFQIELDILNINISDMSISFTLSSLNNWIKKIIEEQKSFKTNEGGLINNNILDFKRSYTIPNNELKITNNKLINNTGVRIYIKYANKAYTIEPYEQIELDYINEWDYKTYGPKNISLALNSNNSYSIPIEKICNRLHKINNVSYIVSENILSKDRQININIYSPIIFKNKSLYQLQINIFNQNKGNAQYFIQKNSELGLPLFYYEPNTFFNFKLIDANNDKPNSTSINYSIDEIVNLKNYDQNYKKNILINNTILLMNLSYKIPNVKTILIGCEYMIINCLPCNIGVTAKNNNYIIEKCSEQYIDFYTGEDGDISIQLTANNTTYFSKPKRLFQKEPKETGNFLKFRNENDNETFRLSLLIKKKNNKKVIIIYAESILDNKSGIDFYIRSRNTCFSLTKDLYLISSKINMENSFFTISNDLYKYSSKSIYFKDIINSSPSYILDLKSSQYYTKNNINNYSLNQIQLIIDNTMSNVTLKNSKISKYNIMTMIYRIHSFYRFTNLLSTKNFVIANQSNPAESIIIEPMSQINFNFFHKGQNLPLIFGVHAGEYNYGKFTTAFRLLQIGMYTFKVGDSLFNLDIKKSSSKGIVDVFITETNYKNAKIVIDNLTKNMFSIYQKNYQSYNQIIGPNKKEILNIYDQNFMKFVLQYDNQNSLEFEFIPSEIQEKQIDLGNNIMMWLESNGIRMKISFFYKNVLEENFNFSINKNYNFAIKINEILVSLIGDNEPKSKNLRNYERKEILLLDIYELFLEIRLDENQGLLGKDVLKTYLCFNNLCLYNQSKKNLKFICALYNENTKCFGIRNEVYHFKNDNVWIIKGFALNLDNLRINIDPVFVEELMDFIKNIIYRMKIKNYNVDKIFLINNDDFQFKNKNNISLSVYQDKIKEYIKSYNENGLVFEGTNFELPQLRINFQISKLGLEHLLINKFAFSSFFIWTAKGLTEQEHSIKLEPYTIPLYIGDFKGIIKKIIQRYKRAVISECVTIGVKGVIGNISKAINKQVGKKVLKFFNNALKKNRNNNEFYYEEERENCSQEINEYERRRLPRAFYGKYKYFKEFNKDHAYFFDLIPKRLSNYNMNFVFIDLLKGNNNNLYVFTNVSLILMTTYLEVYNIIYYFYVAEIKLDKNSIYIRYNQNIDGSSFFQFKEQDETLAAKVAQKLNEFSKNKDELNDV